MNTDILIEAQNFSDNCFHNIKLSQEEFMKLAESHLEAIPDYDDKVAFISEVVKLGKEFLNNSVENLAKLEKRDLAKAGIDLLK